MRPARSKKRASVVDVAKKAGVSQATVSRVFDPKWDGRIRPETRKLVEEAAAALGYRGVNALARSLQGEHSGIVALVVGPSTGYFYLEVIMKFVRRLREAGQQVLIFEVNPTKDLSAILSQVQCYQVDGIVITSAATSQIIDSFSATDIPTVVFNRTVTTDTCSAVYCDGSAAGAAAADFLMEHGHRRFCVITGNQNPSKERHRLEGFCRRVEQLGGEILEIVDGDYRYESGYEAAAALLEHQRPDALFCLEDTIAMGAMDAARELYGLRVPEDLSVMGFDNTTVGRFHPYSLTTVAHPVAEMVDATVELLQNMIQDPTLRSSRTFATKIMVRRSVRL